MMRILVDYYDDKIRVSIHEDDFSFISAKEPTLSAALRSLADKVEDAENHNAGEDVELGQLNVSIRCENSIRYSLPKDKVTVMASELCRMPQSSLMRMPNFGIKSLYELKRELERLGFKPVWRFTPFQLDYLKKSYDKIEATLSKKDHYGRILERRQRAEEQALKER